MIRIRSLSLSLAGFLVVLGLTGCAGSGGGKKSSGGPKVWSPSKPDPAGTVIAIVAGRRITRRDVDSVLAAAPPNIRENYLEDPEQYKMLVDRIVQQETIYLAAQKAGTESDSAYRAEAEAQRRQTLMRHFYQKATRSVPLVPDSAVRGYYDTHLSEFQMPGRARVRHIQVATQAKARDVLKRLRSVSWEQVCARFSTDKVTAKSGGVVGFVTSDADLVPGVGKAPAIVAAAFRLKDGETSEPLKSERAWHVIRVDNKSDAGPRPFAQVERQVRETLQGEQTDIFQKTWMDSLKRAYGVVVFTDSIEVAMKPISSPAELFARAQAAASARDRIELFREVTTKYPNDKSAIQAAFMIGFTYAEELGDYPAARTAFEDFLRKYPKSDLVTSAKWMLENMEHGVPPPGIGVPDTLRLEMLPGGMNSKP
ncbi:MAG TPA: peptidyl-prolyl cis-trans isomerase [Candidatus Eisenbacteria bacterium]